MLPSSKPAISQATVVDSPPPAPPSLDESEWRVGTLTYTRQGLVRLFSWLLWGDFAWSVRDRSLGPVLQLVLHSFHASDKVIGLLTQSIPSAFGVVLGPIISFRSDRYRSSRGRRVPFLLICAPLAGAAILGLGFSPALGGMLHAALRARSPGHDACVLIVLGAWWLVFDFAAMVTNSMFGALINDVVPHGVIGRFYGLMRAVSLLVGIAFSYWLLAKSEAHYQWTFSAVGALYGIGVVAMCLKVREGTYPPPPTEQGSNALVRAGKAVRGYFRECFSRPYYLWFFISGSLGTSSLQYVNTYTVSYYKALGIETDQYGKYIAATYVVSLLLSYALGVLADRFHPLRLSMAVIALYGVAMLGAACVLPDVTTAAASGATGAAPTGVLATHPWVYPAALIVHGILSGTYFTAAATTGQRLLPRTKFAQFSSAGGLIGALMGMVLPFIFGAVLDAHGHNYRLTYLAGGLQSFVALGCKGIVYRHWRKYGGPHNYVAPV